MNLNFNSMNQRLLEQIPALGEPRYTELIDPSSVSEAGQFIVFGIMFNHYLVDIADDGDDDSRRNAAAFLEEMAASTDVYVTLILTEEVLPTLVKDQNILEKFWPWLGPLVRRQLHLLPTILLTTITFPPPE